MFNSNEKTKKLINLISKNSRLDYDEDKLCKKILNSHQLCKLYEVSFQDQENERLYSIGINPFLKSGRINANLVEFFNKKNIEQGLEYYLPIGITAKEFLYLTGRDQTSQNRLSLWKLKSKLNFKKVKHKQRDEELLKRLVSEAFVFFYSIGIDLRKGMIKDYGKSDIPNRFYGAGVDLVREYLLIYNPRILEPYGGKIPPAVIRTVKSK